MHCIRRVYNSGVNHSKHNCVLTISKTNPSFYYCVLPSFSVETITIISNGYLSYHIGAPLILSVEVYLPGLLFYSSCAGPPAPGAALCPFPKPVLLGQSLAIWPGC